ncbi:MAG TPA: sulfate permease [Propionibacteriaceae bacterium]|nr:sulfate permease [Propionibacteriaceae bacterium]
MGARAQRTPWTFRLLPGVDVLRHYRREWLRGDLVAGLTVLAYLVPQVMAYAAVAGLPSVVGLWAAVGPLVVYAVLGSSRQLSVGPESTTALMTAAAVAAVGSGLPASRHAEVAAVLALAVAAVALAAWAVRLGFLAALLSRPVLEGYMVGIAVLMITSQLGRISRLDIPAGRPDEEIGYWVAHLGEAHVATLAVAAGVLVGLFAFQRWLPRAPGPLVMMIVAAVLVAWLGLGRYGVRTVDRVPTGLPGVRVPDLTGLPWVELLSAAAGIVLVGFSDNVLTGRAFAAKRRERIDGNQELLALAGINVAAGLSQGFPVSSSGSRTVLGDAMGSRSQLSSLVTAVGVVVVLLVAAPLLSTFPRAALGAVVIYAALRLVNPGEWRRIARFRRSELLLALAATGAVLWFGVLAGIAVAVVLSVLELLRRLATPHDGILGIVPGVAGMHDIDDYEDAVQVPGLVVYRYDAPLFFGNAENFLRRAVDALDLAPAPPRWLLLNMEANVEVDLTAVDVLDQLRQRVEARGIALALARVKHELFEQLDAAGFVDRVGRRRIFATLPTAVAAFHEEQEDAASGPDRPQPGMPSQGGG